MNCPLTDIKFLNNTMEWFSLMWVSILNSYSMWTFILVVNLVYFPKNYQIFSNIFLIFKFPLWTQLPVKHFRKWKPWPPQDSNTLSKAKWKQAEFHTGLAVLQAMSCMPLTRDTQLKFKASPCGIYGTHNAKPGFAQSTLVVPLLP